MLRTDVPVRVAIGTNHIVVALTAVLASLVHVFGGGLVRRALLDLASTPWNMVVCTVPATVPAARSRRTSRPRWRPGHQELRRRAVRRHRRGAVPDGAGGV